MTEFNKTVFVAGTTARFGYVGSSKELSYREGTVEVVGEKHLIMWHIDPTTGKKEYRSYSYTKMSRI